MRIVWLPTTPCPGSSHHYGTLQNGTRNGLKQHLHHCVQDVNQFGFALFYIYFFGILYIAVGVKIVF